MGPEGAACRWSAVWLRIAFVWRMRNAYQDQRREMGWITYGIRLAATESAHYLSMETYTSTPCQDLSTPLLPFRCGGSATGSMGVAVWFKIPTLPKSNNP